MVRTQNPGGLLSPSEVARALGVSSETLRRWRKAGQGPPAVRLGARVVRYDPATVHAWLEAQGAA